MSRWFEAWLGLEEKGQALVEYALILVLIAVLVIAVLTLLGTQVSQVFSTITSTIEGP